MSVAPRTLKSPAYLHGVCSCGNPKWKYADNCMPCAGIKKRTRRGCTDCGGPCDYGRARCWNCLCEKRLREAKEANRYVSVSIDGKCRREHCIVAERMIGRPLRRGEVVHHKNGLKWDNREENLEVLTNSEHLRLHARLRRSA